jgi:hypothetical protein
MFAYGLRYAEFFSYASDGVFESANMIAFIFCRLLVCGKGEAMPLDTVGTASGLHPLPMPSNLL